MGRPALEKYGPLRDHLANYDAGDQLRLSFSEIEELAGPLPRGARRLRQWWANNSSIQAQAWRAAGWRVLLVDMGSEQVLFGRYTAGHAKPSAESPASAPQPLFRDYLTKLHVPLIAVLVILSVIIGSIGFALRPGTDEPPAVSAQAITLYVSQQGPAATVPPSDPTRVSADEILMRENSSTVLMQLDLFAAFAAPGVAQWQLLMAVSRSQPYPCPDPYNYYGTSQPDPVGIQNAQLTIGGQTATPAMIGNFVGRRSARNASNVLGLYGRSPGVVGPGGVAPIAEVDLCWKSDLPMAFNGEFASAALPAVNVVPEGTTSRPPLDLTRTLYFENIHENPQPITAEYSLQAGTLPTSTDPYGWHWSGSQVAGPVQVTTVDIPVSQHEAYLGFLSGVLFGVVGGAVVLILQEILEPVRIRRRARTPASSPR